MPHHRAKSFQEIRDDLPEILEGIANHVTQIEHRLALLEDLAVEAADAALKRKTRRKK